MLANKRDAISAAAWDFFTQTSQFGGEDPDTPAVQRTENLLNCLLTPDITRRSQNL